MDLFHRLSGARLGNELTHIFKELAPAKGIQRLGKLKLFRFIHPQLQWKAPTPRLFEAIEKILAWQEVELSNEKTERWLMFAMAWFESLGKTELVKTWKRLGFSHKIIKKVGEFLHAQTPLIRNLNKKHLAPSEAYTLLHPWPEEIILFLMAKVQTRATTHRALERIREFLTTWQHTSLHITGHDLESLGLPKGPMYGQILNRIFNAKLDGLITTSEDEYRLAKSLITKRMDSPRSRQSSPSRKGPALRTSISMPRRR